MSASSTSRTHTDTLFSTQSVSTSAGRRVCAGRWRPIITIAEYAAFLNQGGNDGHYHEWMQNPELCGLIQGGPDRYRVVLGREAYPIVLVRHDNALAFAESQGKTLPTEAMWERAARGT